MKKNYYIKLIIVNLITFTRIIGSILMPLYYFKHGIGLFTVLVCLLFLTDTIDGKLSRLFHVETFLGSLLDSVSDKLFAFVLLAMLTYEYNSIFLVIILEFIIFSKNTLAFKNNKNIQSSKIGKIKTIVLDISVSIIYFLIYNNKYNYINILIINKDYITHILIGIILGMQIITINDYSKKFMKNINYERTNFKELKSFKEIVNIMINNEFYLNNKNNNLKELLYK